MVDNRIRIVFVEDHQLVRAGITAYLESVPDLTVVAQVSTAEEGLEEIMRLSPDIVLMDIGLPRLNGIEATALIKQHLPSTRVIMLTSHQTTEEVLAALGAGAHAYCLKDISSDRLVEVIRSVADGAAWLDPTIAHVVLSVFTDPETTNGKSVVTDTSSVLLSQRQRDVLRLMTFGKNNQQIAEELYLSPHTVKSQVSTILQKLAVHDRVRAAVKAITTGLIRPEEVEL